MKTVGFIGVGTIGAPMARCLSRSGFKLIVCDKRHQALDSFREMETNIAQMSKEIARINEAVYVNIKECLLEIFTFIEELKKGTGSR